MERYYRRFLTETLDMTEEDVVECHIDEGEGNPKSGRTFLVNGTEQESMEAV